MLIDIRTLFIVLAVLSAFLSFSLYYIRRVHRHKFKGIGYWAGAHALLSLIGIIFALRGIIHDFFSIVLTNTLVIVFFMLILRGISRFREREGKERTNYVLLALFFVSFVYFGLINVNLVWRIVISSLGFSFLCWQCSWQLIVNVPSNLKISHRFNAVVFGILGLFYFVRIPGTLFFDPGTDYMAAGTYYSINQMIYILAVVFEVIGFVLMTNNRLEVLLRDSIDKRTRALDESLKAQEAVTDRETFLQGILNSIQDGISILDKDLTIVRTNQTMEKWYAHQMPILDRKCYEVYHERDEPCESCPTQRTLRNGKKDLEIVPYISKKGVPGWLAIHTFPMVGSNGNTVEGVIEYIRDISDLKNAEQALKKSLHEKELLIKEIHHRVKNNLSVIQSLLRLQSRKLKDDESKALFKESENRVQSMTMIHEWLYKSGDLKRIKVAEYVKRLVRHLFDNYKTLGTGIAMTIDIDDIQLDINSVIPCGLIINELVSNALKYAFPEGRTGELSVTLKKVKNGQNVLTIQDDGIGIPDTVTPEKADTLGMQIVNSLVRQIEGTLELSRNNGTTLKITFSEQAIK